MSNNIRIAEVRTQSQNIAQLDELNEGTWVEYSDGQYGLIVGEEDGPIKWPTGEDESEKIADQGKGNQIYIVARASGGSKPFTADEITAVDRDTVFDGTGDVPENPEKDLQNAELSQVYYRVNQPHDYEELRSGLDELLSVPGVDDPGVGFNSMPPSWRKADAPARLILLDAYSSMGGTWTGAFQELGSKRLASAIKDEVLQTEKWRGDF